MTPLKHWIHEFLESHDYVFERQIRENELWRNNTTIIVLCPAVGIKLIYRLSMFNEDYTEAVIEKDLIEYDNNKKHS